ncbi:CARDB domain-containing protein [Argonema antarcticum]|uniref:CARDB domain-containing protein n=1 Tax=Argonema antarcticum TaxID=2942763 RepID=UPI00201301B9|nr:CARDB domain-containing protein [Argonema antarcticum]MCL1475464.1 hypothetical protein [Argonema antarcticum A004/B2]
MLIAATVPHNSGNRCIEQNVTLPNNTASGNRYLLFVSDAYKNQSETNEANNVRAVPITLSGPSADLIVSEALAPNIVTVGQTVPVSWKIHNQGDAATNDAYWYDSIYISDDTTLDSSDTHVTDEYAPYHNSWSSLGASSSYSNPVTRDITIPSTKMGNRYLLFVADSQTDIDESKEANNVLAKPIEVKAADLVVDNLTASQTAIASQTINVSWTVRNQGNAATPNYYWSDYLYLSKDTILDTSEDTLITSEWFGDYNLYQPLAPGMPYTVQKDIKLPSVEAGQYYLLLATDGGKSLNEADETNNVKAWDIQLEAPDLKVDGVSAPRTAGLGETVRVNWEVINQGNVPTAAHSWYDYIYLSKDQIYDYSDTYVSSRWMQDKTPVAPGIDYEAFQDITLPKNIAPGSYYLLLISDYYKDQGETDETNNVYAAQIKLNAPDLVVSGRTNSSTVNPGERITVSWKVKNQGEVAATADWNDYVYLSGDRVYDSNDIAIIYPWTGYQTPLAVNSEYEITQENITLPNTGAGERYLLFMADRYNYQGETNEANNIDAVPITINGQNADLALSVLEAPTTAVLGQSIRTKWQVTNVGELPTSNYGWSDRVVISDDTILDSSDTYVISVWSGYYNSYQPMAAGANYTVTQDLWIPATAVGDRYLLFVADGYNNQWETTEVNNTVAVQISLLAPDLVVTSATAPNKSLLPLLAHQISPH